MVQLLTYFVLYRRHTNQIWTTRALEGHCSAAWSDKAIPCATAQSKKEEEEWWPTTWYFTWAPRSKTEEDWIYANYYNKENNLAPKLPVDQQLLLAGYITGTPVPDCHTWLSGFLCSVCRGPSGNIITHPLSLAWAPEISWYWRWWRRPISGAISTAR